MRRVRALAGPPHTGRVNEDRRARWPRVTIPALGLATTAVAALCIVNAGLAATGGESASMHRTVIATVSPQPMDPPQDPPLGPQPVNPMDVVEVPVLVDANPLAAAQPRMDLRQITYTIAGNQRPNEPVTVVYADETGALRTVEKNITCCNRKTIQCAEARTMSSPCMVKSARQ